MELVAGVAGTHGWRPVQHELYGSAHLLVVVAVVAAGVVIFTLALRHLTRRRGRSGRVFLSPTGYPLAALNAVDVGV
jgi:hypothetical protein